MRARHALVIGARGTGVAAVVAAADVVGLAAARTVAAAVISCTAAVPGPAADLSVVAGKRIAVARDVSAVSTSRRRLVRVALSHC